MAYYFAFGSNLWLEQMAKRCPDSRYIGRATLPDYQWQINQRGFANVVPCPGSCVHGLVYELNRVDEAQLDRNEGVNSGVYEKRYLDVTLHTAPKMLRVSARALLSRFDRVRDIDPARHEERPAIQPDVLVYLSTRFITAARPRTEYVDRINDGIRDAVQLGVPAAYFQNAVRSFVPLRAPAMTTNTERRPQRHGKAYSAPAYPREGTSGKLRPRSQPLSLIDCLTAHRRTYTAPADYRQTDDDSREISRFYSH